MSMNGYRYRAVFSNTCGSATSSAATLQVENDEPPTITFASNVSLWPPNHSYATFTVGAIVAGISDDETTGLTAADAEIWKVTSDEPDNANGSGDDDGDNDNDSDGDGIDDDNGDGNSDGGGDGNTTNDIVIASDCKSVDVRRERASSGNGRVYRIYVRVGDDNGNMSSSAAYFTVSIPHSRNRAAVDDGINHDRTCGGTLKPSSAATGLGYLLMQNTPNPFSAATTIAYTVPLPSSVSLAIYDARGSLVESIVDALQPAGTHVAHVDGAKLPSGTYAYVLKSDGVVLARTMVLVR
jgi:hypothetical protein